MHEPHKHRDAFTSIGHTLVHFKFVHISFVAILFV
jgi:hypothetical protein